MELDANKGDEEGSVGDDDTSSTSSEGAPEALETVGRKYLQELTGRRVRDSGVHPGGVGGKVVRTGRGGPKGKDGGQTIGEATAKLKVMVPLVEGMSLRKHLRDLVLNYAVQSCHENKEPVTVVKGTEIREIS